MGLLPDRATTDNGSTISISTVELFPNTTYRMLIEDNRVDGAVKEEIEAVRQAVYKILNTERYKHVIYSSNYGVELEELFGKPIPYVLPEIPRRIKEALIQDDRIADVTGFDLSYTKDGSVLCSFTVETIYGEIEGKKAVKIS